MKRILLLVVALTLMAVAAHADNCPPSKVSDLAAPFLGPHSAQVTFTDAGDDCLTGTAASYEIRRRSSTITESNYYDTGTTVVVSTGSPAGSGGTADCYSVTGLSPSTTYYFTITFIDAAGNRSPVGTNVSFTTPGSGPEKACP